MNNFDLIVIGAGPGGYTAALKAAECGVSVALVEKEYIGGSCVNYGCIPTKAMMYVSELYRQVLNSERFGIYSGEVFFDKSEVLNYKDEIVRASREEIHKELTEKQVTCFFGTATLFPDKKIQVLHSDGEVEELYGDKIILATGANNIVPSIPGIDLPGVMNSKELLSEKQDLLTDLVIIGGGVVGIECAYIMRRFDQKITIIEKKNRILSPMDSEISEVITEHAVARGIDIETNAQVTRIEKVGENKLRCYFSKDSSNEERYVESSHVLTAIGREPNMDQLFASNCPVEMEGDRIKVDSHFCTSIPDVYAIGDLVSDIQLAHVAAAQGTVVVEHILKKKERTVLLSIVPSCLFMELPIIPNCIYLEPEVASVGLSEAEAVSRGMQVRCGKYSMEENLKSMMDSDDYGYIKVVFEKRSDVLVGAQMVCPRATDMIGEMATAIANGLTSKQLMYAMRAHPTYNEAIAKAVENSRKEE